MLKRPSAKLFTCVSVPTVHNVKLLSHNAILNPTYSSWASFIFCKHCIPTINCLSLFKISHGCFFLQDRPMAPYCLWGIVTVHGMMELALGYSNSCTAEQGALAPEKAPIHDSNSNLLHSSITLSYVKKEEGIHNSALNLQKTFKTR